ncbi:MAG: 50S ribosomal protein L10, partial [Chloroflexota bacterium]
LRRQLGAREIGYRVVKNTLARLAAERAGKGTLAGRLVGPVALAYGYGDITIPAKVLRDYLRGAKASLTITGGFVGSRLLTAEEVTTLATLPGREVLLAKVLGGMQAPIYGLANCLAAPLRGLAEVLRARIQQLEGA